MRVSKALYLSAATLGLATGCAAPTDPPNPERIRFTLRALSLPQLESVQVIVRVHRGSHSVPVHDATFESLDIGIVVITKDGVARSVGPRGSTRMVASRGGSSDTIPVSVAPVAAGIRFHTGDLRMRQDSTLVLSPAVLDRVNAPIDDHPVTLQSLTPWTVAVEGNAVRAVGPGTTAQIRGQAGALVDTATLHVIQFPTAFSVWPRALAVRQGESEFLGTSLTDLFGDFVVDRPIARTVAAPIVTFIGSDVVGERGGQSVITARVENFTAAVPVTVVPDSVDAAIRIRLYTPGAVAAVTPVESVPVVVASIPSRDVLLRLEWGHWGFTDTIPLAGHPGPLAAVPERPFIHVGLTMDHAVARVSMVSGAVTGRLQLTDPAVALATGPDVGLTATATQVFTYDAASMGVLDSLPLAGISHLAIHPSAPLAYGTEPDSGRVWVLTLAPLTVAARWDIGGRPRSSAVAAPTDRLYVADESGVARAVTLGTGTVAAGVMIGAELLTVEWRGDANGQDIYFGAVDGRIHNVDFAAGAVRCVIRTGGAPTSGASAAQGWTVLVANAGGWVDFLGLGTRSGGPLC